MMRRLSFFLIGFCLLWPLVSLAEEQADLFAAPVEVDVAAEQVGRFGFEGIDAEAAYTEYKLEAEWLFLLLEAERREYDWSGTGGNAPWQSLTRVAPGLQYYQDFGNNWGIWLKFYAMAGYEDKIRDGSWTYKPQLITFYAPQDKLKLYGGIGELYHPAYTTVYPVLGIAWNLGSKDGFSGAVGFPETVGRYHFNERLAVKADFLWDIRIYSLADDNAVAPGGYVRTEDLKPGLHLEYEPEKGVRLTAGVRRYLWRSMMIFDSHENEVVDRNAAATWAFVVGGGIDL